MSPLKQTLVIFSFILVLIVLLKLVTVQWSFVQMERGREKAQPPHILPAGNEQWYPIMERRLLLMDNRSSTTIDSIDIGGISKWQQDQVKTYCSKYGSSQSHFKLQDPHLLFNEERKLLFCYVPKVGCTYLKEFMFILAGVIPASAIANKKVKVPIQDFNRGFRKISFKRNTTLLESDRQQMLRTYWKFVIVRNPLERLLSAFRNKLSLPLATNPSPNIRQIKHHIMEKYHKAELATKHPSNLRIDFPTFIRWIVDNIDIKNDHFMQTIDIIHPCTVNYDFYGNFKHLSSDMQMVMDKFNLPQEYYRGYGYYGSGQNTTALLKKYYSTVSADLKRALFELYRSELSFYYQLFPEEKDSHVILLGVDEELL